MARDRDKIQAFSNLFTENFSNLVAEHLEDLEALKTQLSDDDEQNAAAIEKWLAGANRQSLRNAYEEQLNALSSVNPLLGGTDREIGIGGSKATPKTSSPSLEELIDNAKKRNTNPPPKSEKNPQ